MSEIMNKFPLYMYKLYGLWPKKDSHIAYKIYGATYHLITLDLYLIYMMICFYKVTNLEEFTDTACIGGIFFATWLKSINMIYHLDNVRALFHLLKDVIDFSDEGKTRNELKSATRRVLRAYKMFAFMALMNVLNNFMLTFTNTENKLPYFFWFPIDFVDNNTVFWIVATFQNIASLTNCILVCILDMLPVYFMSMASSLIAELNERLQGIGKIGTSFDEYKEEGGGGAKDEPRVSLVQVAMTRKLKRAAEVEEFMKSVIIHKKMIDFVEKIQETFSTLIMVHGFVSILILCTATFSLSLASPLNEPQVFLKYLSYCMPMLLEIFLPCYFGSEILTNSQELLTSIYHSNWTVTNKRYKTMMLIFVERTKKSLSVSAVRVVQLNLETFTRICNTTYSFYTLLQRVRT